MLDYFDEERGRPEELRACDRNDPAGSSRAFGEAVLARFAAAAAAAADGATPAGVTTAATTEAGAGAGAGASGSG
jgi:hypothetical protein